VTEALEKSLTGQDRRDNVSTRVEEIWSAVLSRGVGLHTLDLRLDLRLDDCLEAQGGETGDRRKVSRDSAPRVRMETQDRADEVKEQALTRKNVLVERGRNLNQPLRHHSANNQRMHTNVSLRQRGGGLNEEFYE